MNDSTRKILNALGSSAKPTGFGESSWIAKCPAHDDQKASLSVTDGENGRCVVYCHAGCTYDAVIGALGLNASDLFPVKPTSQDREISATYDYKNKNGDLLYQVVRYFPKDFRQRRPDGKGGFIYNLQGTPKVLYRTEKIAKADPEETIFIVEGERDVHTLERLGLTATTNAGGAGKWLPTYSDLLKGRRITIIPDNDNPGKEHARLISDSLQGIAASILILELPGLSPKGDISDWIQNGHTLHDLMLLILKAEETHTIGIRYLDISQDPQPIEWLVDGWISTNDIVLLAGRPGGGKSTTAADIAIAIAGGRNGDGWLGHRLKYAPVLYLDEEAGEREIIRQFQRQGGRHLPDLHVSSCNGYSLANRDTIERIEHDIQEKKPGLIILDTASKFFAGANENDANEIAALFVPLMDWRDRFGVATLIVHHLRKPSMNGPADDLMDRIRGSSSFTSQPSAVWTAVPSGNGFCMDLAVHKRRGGGPKRSLRIEYTEHEDGSVSLSSQGEPTHAESQVERISRDVAALFRESPQHKRSEVVTLLKDHDEKLVDKALRHLLDIQFLTRPKTGWYALDDSKILPFPPFHKGEGGNLGGNEGNEED